MCIYITTYISISGDAADLALSYPTGNLYALVPFTINCTAIIPTDITLHVEIQLYKDGEQILDSDNAFNIESSETNAAVVVSKVTITEPLPIAEVMYSCTYKTELIYLPKVNQHLHCILKVP